ncbi:hypothetical protein BBP40_005159 [Aspergillus hancockii]|nr:hypothetical protein BBP40_005159 [Aspergillus hancockii]
MRLQLPKQLADRIPARWWNYEKVDSIESANEKSQTSSRKPPTRNYLAVFAGLTVFGVAIFTILGIHQYYAGRNVKSSTSRELTTNTCGNSTAEALALGCKFDQLMWAWYPAHCPHYANDEYLNAEPERPWRFYINPYTRQVANEDEWLQAMDNKIIRDGTKYTPRQVEYAHLEHCAEFLLESLRNDTHWYDVQTQAPHVLYNQDC